jgi:hypothetical protein
VWGVRVFSVNSLHSNDLISLIRSLSLCICLSSSSSSSSLIAPHHHLLFVFKHITCRPVKGKKKNEPAPVDVLAFAFLPLFVNGRFLKVRSCVRALL